MAEATEKRWLKPAQAAKFLASHKTGYRMLPQLIADGVEVVKLSERVTLINANDLARWRDAHRVTEAPAGGPSAVQHD